MKKEHRLLKSFGLVLLSVFFLIGVVLTVILALLAREPEGFGLLLQTNEKKEEVNTYLTHYLAPNVYNNFQLDKPFEVIVPQDGINGILAEEKMLGWQWPVKFNKIVTIEKPSIFFTENNVTLMGEIDLAGFDVVITVSAMPVIDEEGLLHLNIQSVSAGALDISGLARNFTSKIINRQIDEMEEDYWLRDLKGAFLDNEPFDPVFPAYDKYIRLTRAELSTKKLVLFFEPAMREDKPAASK